jgi:DNA-binding MarR family transcriptional regulator
MVEPDRIRAYAQALQQQPVFRQLVLWYVAYTLQHELLNTGEEARALLANDMHISQEQILHLEEQLAEALHQPAFWETCATKILEQLDAWQASGQRPDNLERGGLATGSRHPLFSSEEAIREAEVRDRFAAEAAALLIEHLGLLHYEVAQLDELLGLKAKQERLKKASSKLSQLQKKILLALFEKAGGYRQPVTWEPTVWFGPLTGPQRTAISHALKQLEARALIRRQAATDKGLALRTAFVELTALGYQVVQKLLQTTHIIG